MEATLRFQVDISTPSLPKRRPLRLLMVITMVVALTVPTAVIASHLFSDVPNSNMFHGDISTLALSGVTAGCGGSNFCPSTSVTREQMAAFLGRGMGRVALKALNTLAVPAAEAPALWTFQITPGIPGGATPAARQFIKADADISVVVTNETGCPCTFRAALYVTGVGYMTPIYSDVTLDTNNDISNLSMNGAIAVSGGAKTVEVRIFRSSGTGTANAYGNATAEMFPLSGAGTNAFSAPALSAPDANAAATR